MVATCFKFWLNIIIFEVIQPFFEYDSTVIKRVLIPIHNLDIPMH